MPGRAKAESAAVIGREPGVRDDVDIAEQGNRMAALFSDDALSNLTPEQRRAIALSALGAWRDLDGDELLEAIERGRRERQPSELVDDL